MAYLSEKRLSVREFGLISPAKQLVVNLKFKAELKKLFPENSANKPVLTLNYYY